MLVSIASTDTYTHTERERGSKRKKWSLIADNPEVIRGTLQEIEKTDWASATIAMGSKHQHLHLGSCDWRPLTDDPNSAVDLDREQCYMRPWSRLLHGVKWWSTISVWKQLCRCPEWCSWYFHTAEELSVVTLVPTTGWSLHRILQSRHLSSTRSCPALFILDACQLLAPEVRKSLKLSEISQRLTVR